MGLNKLWVLECELCGNTKRSHSVDVLLRVARGEGWTFDKKTNEAYCDNGCRKEIEVYRNAQSKGARQ